MTLAPTKPERRLHVVQGEQCVTQDGGLLLTTLLGSCVSACLQDPVAMVGGMNHFLLPGHDGVNTADLHRHGVHAMELLVNAMLQQGARKDRMRAWLFGGGCMMDRLTDVGKLNAGFAERFIRRERIALQGTSLGGDGGRRIEFWPVAGRARARPIARGDAAVLASERSPQPVADTGTVELF